MIRPITFYERMLIRTGHVPVRFAYADDPKKINYEEVFLAYEEALRETETKLNNQANKELSNV